MLVGGKFDGCGGGSPGGDGGSGDGGRGDAVSFQRPGLKPRMDATARIDAPELGRARLSWGKE